MSYFFTTFILLSLGSLITNVDSFHKGVENVEIDMLGPVTLPQENIIVNDLGCDSMPLHVMGSNSGHHGKPPHHGTPDKVGGLLASWNASTSKSDFIVAQDGSGNFNTINDAVAALAKLGNNRPERVVIYVKCGTYNEHVEIGEDLKNVMLVGDGMDKTVITDNQCVKQDTPTFQTATFGVSGDGFWARDITFQNTAGPQKHQAVALRVLSDKSVFYRCRFMGFQDTLYVQHQRQFYRDCQIYGTIDFIFGDAAAVFQNCDIFARKPMHDQAITITAQGRENANSNTGISIINSRVRPTKELVNATEQYKVYLGRPWKQYSRTVFIETYIDGMVDKAGWSEWEGDFALSTLYYAEYCNNGSGASTINRVKWPGYHVLTDPHEANMFSVRNFISGDCWIPNTGVPFE